MQSNRMMMHIMCGIAGACLLVGCGSTTSTTIATDSTVSAATNTASESATEAATEAVAETTQAVDQEEQSVLVAYYSGTGNTARVAQNIAEVTNGDLFEITPVSPYTSEDLDYNDTGSRVSLEHADDALQDIELVTTTVEGWEDYDIVFIGYPIWWGNAAWPVNRFVSENDYTGKIVIPFTTSASSGIGDSANTLAALAGTGNWQEGHRFSSNTDADEVAKWVAEVLGE